ncbi:PLC-like phosphodiesterase [Hymenopellis radicata]|nr:PLC-like phosphodiesterase [Hymenopellis radicata]
MSHRDRSNGQPISEELVFESKLSLRKRSTGLSASIRRKFNNIVRSRSLLTPPHHDGDAPPLPIHAHSSDAIPSRATTPNAAEVHVPLLLQSGTSLTKVTNKKHKKVVFRLDADQGQIVWEGKSHRLIPIEAIKEIRSGQDARYYREQFQLAPEYEQRWLTIIYILDGNYKTLHVVAPTRDLHAIRQELMKGLGNVEMRQAMWEKHYWKNADEESDQKLVFDEVSKLCRRLNINTGAEDLYRLFKQADSQNRDYLDFQDFRQFVRLLKSRPEIDRLYKKHRTANGFDLAAFEKKSPLSHDELEAVFLKYSSTVPSTPPLEVDSSPELGTPSATPVMTWESFTAFLMSSDNPALSIHDRMVTEDMTQPLSEYYISSSHNTYLVGHQLVGASTIEGYIRALLHSCRSVEVDIYDGDDEPMIFHGKDLHIQVWICGFPYPIIISAEIHCGLEQQDKVAEIMIKVFGDALVQRTDDLPIVIRELPSPEALKGKVLLKVRFQHLFDVDTSDDLVCDVSASSTSESDDDWRKPMRRQSDTVYTPKPIRPPVKHHRSSSITFGSPPSSPRLSSRPAPDPLPKVKMSSKLLNLLVYTVGVKCRGINKKEEYAPEHMFSLSENAVNKMIRSGAMMDLIKHTRGHLVRIYPKGMRLSSSNYEPHRYWSAGAQLVALNWQTFDLGYMINHAMFQRNGRSGYVLKPKALRTASKESLAQRSAHYLDITIISAQQLPRPKDGSGREIVEKGTVDPYVEVSVHVPDWTHEGEAFVPPSTNGSPNPNFTPPTSHPTTARTITYRTAVVKNNGFNPVWEEKLRIPFDCVGGMKELIFVRFVVRQGGQEDEEPLAVFCASLGSLQHGYRHLPLHDSQMSQYLFSTLFVRIGVIDSPP